MKKRGKETGSATERATGDASNERLLLLTLLHPKLTGPLSSTPLTPSTLFSTQTI